MQKLTNEKGYDTDKSQQYLDNYEKYFCSLKDKPITLLEIGIFKGGSLLLWHDYFSKGRIVGLDINKVTFAEGYENIIAYQGRQDDVKLLSEISIREAPEGYDIIIDDASHEGELTKKTFWHLFDNHLKSDGIYVIEDWGTGYWDVFKDGHKFTGENHLSGLVGFVKELVDECGMGDITHKDYGVGKSRASKFKTMQLSHGQVIIVKN